MVLDDLTEFLKNAHNGGASSARNSLDSHLGKDKLTLERFSLSLASPDTKNERNLFAKIEKKIKNECVSQFCKKLRSVV